MKNIKSSANQSVRPYSSNQQYLYAMIEDLAEWLKGLYGVNIDVDNFFKVLENGTLLCKHANNITYCAKQTKKLQPELKNIPKMMLTYKEHNVSPKSFFARDNIASFIDYCANQLQIAECVRFETNDLVLRNNQKNVVLCLLEVARKGSRYGVPAPLLVQMEKDIDEEIELNNSDDNEAEEPVLKRPIKQRVDCDFKSLDEMVQYILQMCSCPTQFPMVRVGEGKYKVGNSKNLIFMRILRQHVMVRVGGGWDTLEHYLDKHDPCRCKKHRSDVRSSPKTPRSSSVTSKRQSLPSSKDQHPVSSNISSNNNNKMATNRVGRSLNISRGVRSSSATQRSAKKVLDASTSRIARPSSVTRHKQSTSSSVERIRYNPESPRSSSLQSSKDKITYNSFGGSTENVFTRLSQTKSSSSVSSRPSNDLIFQNDLVHIQRDKSGCHQVHRKSVESSASTRSNRPDHLPIHQKSSDILIRSKTQSTSNQLRSPDLASMTQIRRQMKIRSNTETSGAPKIQMNSNLRQRFNSNLEKNYLSYNRSQSLEVPTSPESPEILSNRKTSGSGVPLIKRSMTPLPKTPRFDLHQIFPNYKSEDQTKHPRSPISSSSSHLSPKDDIQEITPGLTSSNKDHDLQKKNDPHPKDFISSSNSENPQKTFTKQTAVDDDVIASIEVDSRDSISPDEAPSSVNEEELINTNDYMKRVFDPDLESQILDSLEKECLQNLAHLEMNCSLDDLESLKDIYS